MTQQAHNAVNVKKVVKAVKIRHQIALNVMKVFILSKVIYVPLVKLIVNSLSNSNIICLKTLKGMELKS